MVRKWNNYLFLLKNKNTLQLKNASTNYGEGVVAKEKDLAGKTQVFAYDIIQTFMKLYCWRHAFKKNLVKVTCQKYTFVRKNQINSYTTVLNVSQNEWLCASCAPKPP